MALIGYHASHEQFAPEALLDHVREAEAAGFQAVMSSDHFHPWSRAQGHSGFVWAWLGAAMQATTLPFGTLCIPGGWRYHPAVVAQAAATLDRLFPDRLQWLAPGSGEALNEAVIGCGWPDKDLRRARLGAAADIMRRLWAGETVNADTPIPVRDATLYSRPLKPPRLVAPALTPETAAWAGRWADGLITISAPRKDLVAIVDAFRSGGGEGKPIALQVHLSWGSSDAEAREWAFDQWRSNAITPVQSETLRTPEAFESATAEVRAEDMDSHVRISADPERHVAWLNEDLACGFDEIYLHNVGRNQRDFILAFGERVLPSLSRSLAE
ncbi:TIGR03885 family FMN-dependent LLM class oxidoreductase [Sphingosinicella sp. CPCC 101087]|uniref:TIGR03885 family FMN-dependent LLM class oxidoreductase n=1 Tax=Sphingosinicella sp. CPCC 101087 TaxID=2497754 RepID=UPI00101C52A4|nr:TIGR03885 family FMN-dependent LLM class oxidoreductase [Sphingosinicella sp. CPCC 101087]